MAESFIASSGSLTSTGNPSITLPAGIQGDDIILVALASGTSSGVTGPAGWTAQNTQQINSATHMSVWSKVAAGAAGSASTDASTTLTWVLPVSGKSAMVALVIRGADPDAPITDIEFVGGAPAASSTSWTGPSVTTTVDGAMIASFYMDKNSVGGFAVTAPADAGWTARQAEVFSTGTGKLDCCAATAGPVNAGVAGAVTWTASDTPSQYGIFTVAVSPVPSTQTAHPTTDVSSTSATGVSDNTHLYANVDESTLDMSDWVEMVATGNFEVGLAAVSDPGTDTGWIVHSTFGLGSGATGGTMAVTLYQSTTQIETWNVTISSDGQQDDHALSSANVADITFTGGAASDLRIKYTASSVS